MSLSTPTHLVPLQAVRTLPPAVADLQVREAAVPIGQRRDEGLLRSRDRHLRTTTVTAREGKVHAGHPLSQGEYTPGRALTGSPAQAWGCRGSLPTPQPQPHTLRRPPAGTAASRARGAWGQCARRARCPGSRSSSSLRTHTRMKV